MQECSTLMRRTVSWCAGRLASCTPLPHDTWLRGVLASACLRFRGTFLCDHTLQKSDPQDIQKYSKTIQHVLYNRSTVCTRARCIAGSHFA